MRRSLSASTARIWVFFAPRPRRSGRLSAKIEGIKNPKVEQQAEQQAIDVEVDLEKARAYGLKPGDVRRAASALIGGITVGSLFQEQKVFDVVVWGRPDIRKNLNDVQNLLIDTESGAQVRLGDVARVGIACRPQRDPSAGRFAADRRRGRGQRALPGCRDRGGQASHQGRRVSVRVPCGGARRACRAEGCAGVAVQLSGCGRDRDRPAAAGRPGKLASGRPRHRRHAGGGARRLRLCVSRRRRAFARLVPGTCRGSRPGRAQWDHADQAHPGSRTAGSGARQQPGVARRRASGFPPSLPPPSPSAWSSCRSLRSATSRGWKSCIRRRWRSLAALSLRQFLRCS